MIKIGSNVLCKSEPITGVVINEFKNMDDFTNWFASKFMDGQISRYMEYSIINPSGDMVSENEKWFMVDGSQKIVTYISNLELL